MISLTAKHCEWRYAWGLLELVRDLVTIKLVPYPRHDRTDGFICKAL